MLSSLHSSGASVAMSESLFQLGILALLTSLLISAVLTVLHYPYDTDESVSSADAAADEYYEDAYDTVAGVPDGERFLSQDEYVDKARAHAIAAGIPEFVKAFLDES